MCLVAIYFRVAEGTPLVVGANREEFFARPGEPPMLWEGPPRLVAGRDSRAGGTWLGVNEHGLLVAVTNRRKSADPTAPRSRGLLTVDLLACRHAAEAAELASRELSTDCYAGCNYLLADAQRAFVIQAGDWLRLRPLPPGLHVLANRDVNDPMDPRAMLALDFLSRQPYQTSDDCLAALRRLCPRHEPGEPPICLVGADKGTVSSTLIALPEEPCRGRYLHAQGPPNQTPYQDCSALLRGLTPNSP